MYDVEDVNGALDLHKQLNVVSNMSAGLHLISHAINSDALMTTIDHFSGQTTAQDQSSRAVASCCVCQKILLISQHDGLTTRRTRLLMTNNATRGKKKSRRRA